MERCNFSCTSCYLADDANSTPPLPFGEVKKQLEALREYLGRGGNVQITSGEVTLLPREELAQIIRCAIELELSPMLMTNGQIFLEQPGVYPGGTMCLASRLVQQTLPGVLMAFDYDYLVIGSGFGGAVSALRMAEKGWRVAVVEQGRKIESEDIKKGKKSVFKLMWMPRIGMRGYFTQHFFSHVSIVGGVGVGGGSLVWAAVMLEPKPEFYADEQLASLGVDWKQELAPHFVTAKTMLGVAINPRHTEQDEFLQQTANRMGQGDTFAAVPNAIYFNQDEQAQDPYFDGAGPLRKPCTFCGGCLTGCPYGSKNSLNFNYLHLAQQQGVEIHTERMADQVTALPTGGYQVRLLSPYCGKPVQTLTARKVILSAGVVGTLEILFKNRDVYQTLPGISQVLGSMVRTNSEAITAVLHPSGADMTDGAAISSDFHPDPHTHVTQNRFDEGYRFMRSFMVPLTGGTRPMPRALKTIWNVLTSPSLMFKNWFIRDWEKRITVFTIMQDLDNYLAFNYRPRWWLGFRSALSTGIDSPEHAPPSFLPVANQVTQVYADVAGGEPMNTGIEAIGAMSTTAHILSGCSMGSSADNSTIGTDHQVHNCPGLFVVDGSSIPANIGVNPSLTITAMAERFAALQPAKAD